MIHTSGVGGSASLQTLLSQTDRVSDTRGGAQPAKASNTGIAGADKTALSSTGGTLAKAALQATDDVRTDKVAQLQAAIANGSYQVPASAVADKLIKNLIG